MAFEEVRGVLYSVSAGAAAFDERLDSVFDGAMKLFRICLFAFWG